MNTSADIQHGIVNELLPFGDRLLATREIVQSGIIGVGEQFRESASVYEERYRSVQGKRQSIELGLAGSDALLPDTIVALDIGCGPGDTTIALLEMFKNSHVYSTDLSPEMLMLLVGKADHLGLTRNITPFVADASMVAPRDRAFDLILGSSMIHHLMEPDLFLDRMLSGLKPNGIALFYEPFQAGHIVLRTILFSIVELAAYKGELSKQRTNFFKDYIFTIDTMCREDNRDPAFYAGLEDKCMFATTTFQRAAERNGCRYTITPTNPPQNTFALKIQDLLRQGLGDTDPLPNWCDELISKTDLAVSASARRELLLEACVTFTRPSRSRREDEEPGAN
jgi:ubiquinone/menaquinone biosynthesis C-methylase UbiE